MTAVAIQMDAAVRERLQPTAGALQMLHQLRQRGDGIDGYAFHQGSLGGVHGRHIGAADALVAGHRHHRQDAGGMAQSAVQRQFAQKDGRFGRRQSLAGAEQDADGDGQIVGGAGFFQVGRRQVDGDAAHGELAAAVADGGAHPLFGLLHGGIGQPHDVKSGQPRRDVGFGLDNLPVQAQNGAGLCGSQH